MKKWIVYLPVLLLAVFPTAKAQVLFSEDFDSYSPGHLINDYTSTIPDQGGWFNGGTPPITASVMVTPETGKGNVVVVTSNGTATLGAVSFRQVHGSITTLWNNRTAGNNILKFEYEFYGASDDFFNAIGRIQTQGSILIDVEVNPAQGHIRGNYYNATSVRTISLLGINQNVPLDVWTKVEMYVDYNTNEVYFYIPSLNILKTASFSHNIPPANIEFPTRSLRSSSVVKFDNIKLSALQTLPSHLVSVNEFVSSKFNVFPNPVTDVVTITNSENIGIEQIEVFDSSGKTVKSLSFNNENEVQLHMSDFAVGMYLLHIKTNEGTAVKKVVKR